MTLEVTVQLEGLEDSTIKKTIFVSCRQVREESDLLLLTVFVVQRTKKSSGHGLIWSVIGKKRLLRPVRVERKCVR